jgi:taurine dioxygenase
VIRVPGTDKQALFVNQFNTSHLVEYGADSAEGEDLIQTLFGYLYDETNTYAHHYRDNDLVIWNNIGLQHARTGVIDTAPRHLRRVVLTSKSW